jgi:Tfp pilus assembly protein PilN
VKRVRIDFAAPSLQRTLHQAGPVAWSLSAAALLLCAGAALLGWRLLEQKELDRQRLDLARATTAAAAVSAPPPAPAARISELQAAAVNADVLQLNLPWRALRDAIAAGTPPGIALLALEPDAHKRSMRITAEAKTSDEMVGYIALLKQQELFRDVALTRHEINDQDPNRPLRFQLEAEWKAE